MTFTKLGKRIMAFIAVIALGLVLVGCTNEEKVTLEKAQANVETVAGRIIMDKSVTSNVTTNLSLASSYAAIPEVKYEWTSSEEDLVTIVKNEDGTITAQVTRPEATDTRIQDDNDYVLVKLTVTLTQTASNGEIAKAEKTFELKVKVVKVDVYGTIAEVRDAAIKQYVDNNYAITSSTKDYSLQCTTYGRIIAFASNKSMYIADGEDVIVVYGDFSSKYSVNDLVKVEGLVYGYYGVVEFGNEVNVTKLSEDDKVLNEKGQEWREQSDFVTPTYESKKIYEYVNVLKAAINAGNRITDAKAFANFSGATYNVYGKLVKETLATGDSYALVDPYSGEKVALYHYSTDDNKTELDALVNQYVTMNAITVDRYSTNSMYRLFYTGELKSAQAPTLTDAEKVAYVSRQLEYALAELPTTYYNNQDFAYPTVTLEGVNVSWTVDPESVLVNNKFVVTENGNVTFTATVTCGDETQTVSSTHKVEAVEKINTIAEVYAGSTGSDFTIEGTVQAVFSSYRNFYISDATGTLLVYSSLPSDLKPGDKVKVKGTKDEYNGCAQFKKGATVTLVEAGTWTPAETKVVTIDELLAYTQSNAPFNQYLEIKGQLVTGSDGYKWFASLEDSSKQISLYYSTVDAIEDYLDTGKELTIKAYFYGFGTNVVRVVFSGRDGEYTLPELSDADKVNAAANTFKDVNVTKNDTISLDKTKNGCTLTWTLVDAAGVATLEGNTLTITQGTEDAVVTLKVVVSLNDASKEVTVKYNVAKKVEEKPVDTKSVTYTFADLTEKGTKLDDATAQTIFGTNNGLQTVNVTNVYSGNADGGAYQNTAGFLKFGTSKANGELKLTFAEGTKVTKVVINCHDWYKKSANYTTNSNNVSVNGCEAVLAPYTEDGTAADLTFTLTEASNIVDILVSKRIFVFSITVYFE